MRVGNEAAGTLVRPFDRSAELARRMHDAEMFGIGRLLHAERAADPVGQNPDLVALDAEHAGDVVAEAEHALVADMQRPMAALSVVIGDRRARLHRIDHDAVVAQFEMCDMRGTGKGGGDRLAVAKMEIEPDIARHVIIEQRRVPHCRGGHRRAPSARLRM